MLSRCAIFEAAGKNIIRAKITPYNVVNIATARPAPRSAGSPPMLPNIDIKPIITPMKPDPIEILTANLQTPVAVIASVRVGADLKAIPNSDP